MGQKLTIEPVTRVEGHGKVTIHLDDENNVVQSRLHIVEFRGFEKICSGKTILGSAGSCAKIVRHLPGQPPSGCCQSSRCYSWCRAWNGLLRQEKKCAD
jgi:hypothetical protein